MVSADLLHRQVDVDIDAVEGKITRREYRPDANDQLQLLRVKGITSRLSEVWPEPPPHGHLHVFVGLPPQEEDRPTIYPEYCMPFNNPTLFSPVSRRPETMEETYAFFVSRAHVRAGLDDYGMI